MVNTILMKCRFTWNAIYHRILSISRPIYWFITDNTIDWHFAKLFFLLYDTILYTLLLVYAEQKKIRLYCVTTKLLLPSSFLINCLSQKLGSTFASHGKRIFIKILKYLIKIRAMRYAKILLFYKKKYKKWTAHPIYSAYIFLYYFILFCTLMDCAISFAKIFFSI